MVIIYKMCGGKEVVGVANNWEDFVLYKSQELLEKDFEYYGNWEIRDYESLLKQDYWAEPVENFSDCMKG